MKKVLALFLAVAMLVTLNVGALAATGDSAIEINIPSLGFVIREGQKIQLEYEIKPEGALSPDDLIWVIDDENIMTIDENNIATGGAVGTTKMALKSKSDESISSYPTTVYTIEKEIGRAHV